MFILRSFLSITLLLPKPFPSGLGKECYYFKSLLKLDLLKAISFIYYYHKGEINTSKCRILH